MHEGELMEFLYLVFGLGVVMTVYYPSIWNMILPLVALVGAFYLVWGLISRLTSTFTHVGSSRRNDWWNGIAILVVVMLMFERPDLALNAVYLIMGLILGSVVYTAGLLASLA